MSTGLNGLGVNTGCRFGAGLGVRGGAGGVRCPQAPRNRTVVTPCGRNMGAPGSVPTVLSVTTTCRFLPMLHTSMRCRFCSSGGTNVTGNGRGCLAGKAGRCLTNVRFSMAGRLALDYNKRVASCKLSSGCRSSADFSYSSCSLKIKTGVGVGGRLGLGINCV